MIEDIYLDSYNQSYHLEEFRFSPVGLSPYTIYNSDFVNIPPIEIYSSKNIERRVLERVKESKITSDIADLIERGLNNKKIIVGYTNPSKFKFVYQKIKQLAGLKRDWGLGFYDKLDDVTYIILDDNINILGNSKFDLPLIIAHELCHMAAAQNNKTKIIESNMNNILLPFFSNLIIHIAENDEHIKELNINFKQLLKENIDILIKCLKHISTKIEVNYNPIDSKNYISGSNFLDNIEDIWDIYLEKIFKKVDYISLQKIRQIILYSFEKKYIWGHTDINFLTDDAIKFSYKKIGINIGNQLIGQEPVYISEVLAISNENGFQSNVLKCIKKIDMGK